MKGNKLGECDPVWPTGECGPGSSVAQESCKFNTRYFVG